MCSTCCAKGKQTIISSNNFLCILWDHLAAHLSLCSLPKYFRFVWTLCHIRGKYVISSSQNFMHTIHVVKFILSSWDIMDLEGSSHDQIYALTWHWPGGTEEHREYLTVAYALAKIWTEYVLCTSAECYTPPTHSVILLLKCYVSTVLIRVSSLF
jgi:hypothetical protein